MMPLNVDIITRQSKGSPLTVSELDLNFENLKTASLSAYAHAEDVVGGNIDWSQVSFSLDGWLTTKNDTSFLIDFDLAETTYDADIAKSLGSGKTLSLGSGNLTSSIVARNSLTVDSTENDGLNLLDLKHNSVNKFSVDKDGVMFLENNTTPTIITEGALWFDGTTLQIGTAN